MTSIRIFIENKTVQMRFRRALNQASSVASSMIEVKTKISDEVVFKTVRTECPSVISIFSAFQHDGGAS